MARVAAMISLNRTMIGWSLEAGGETVSQVCLDYAVALRLQNEVTVRIEQSFSIFAGRDHSTITPDGGTHQLCPALGLLRSVVSRFEMLDDGHLEISFGAGMRLLAPPHADFEAWEVSGPDGFRVVSTPGGELSVWTPKPKHP